MQDLRTFLSGMFVVAALLTVTLPLLAPTLASILPTPATFAARALPLVEFFGSIVGGVAALWFGRHHSQ